jgi:hypothetical protein
MEIIKRELMRLGDLAARSDTPRKEREAIRVVIRTFVEKHRQNPAVRAVVGKNPMLLEIWEELVGEEGSA